MEYRKELKVLFDNIVQLVSVSLHLLAFTSAWSSSSQDPKLAFDTVQSSLSHTLTNLSFEPFMNVEVALRSFYMMGEIITEKVNQLLFVLFGSQVLLLYRPQLVCVQ